MNEYAHSHWHRDISQTSNFIKIKDNDKSIIKKKSISYLSWPAFVQDSKKYNSNKFPLLNYLSVYDCTVLYLFMANIFWL